MFVVVGVTGGIAAYKTVQLVRTLVTNGHEVHVVPTEDALRFVGTATWEAVSRNPVTTSVHDDVAETRRLRRAGIVDVDVASLTEQRDAVDHRGGLEAQDRVRADAQVSVDAGGVALPRSQRLPVRERRPHAGAHPMVRAMRGPYARSRGIARREQRRGREELGAIAEQKGHAASVDIRRAPWGG